jgi:uncharacterized membrane protein YGL010W
LHVYRFAQSLTLSAAAHGHIGFNPGLILLSALAAGCLALLFGLLATVFATLLAARFGSFAAGLLAMLSTTLLATGTATCGLVVGR